MTQLWWVWSPKVMRPITERRFKGWQSGAQRTTWASTSKKQKNWSLITGRSRTHTPLHINGETVERVSSFKFLGIHIPENLSWAINTTAIVKKAQQRLYFLRTLRKVNLSQQHLRSFYRCSIESVLTYGILPWYGSSSAADRKSLQRIIKTAQNIINQQLPTMDTIFNSRCLQKTHNILKDSYHPANYLFELLPSGKRYRSIRTRTTRFINSFYPKAVTILNWLENKSTSSDSINPWRPHVMQCSALYIFVPLF